MFKFVSAFLLSGLVSQGAIYFEPNHGQAPAPLSFIGRTPEGTIAVRSDGAALLARGGAGLQVKFRNANDNAPGTGEGLVAGVSHYVKGADASRWVWDVPHFERVRFRGTYPGVDVVYHSREGRMEFDFEVAAGVDADRIRMHFSESVRLLRNGALATSAGMLHKPVAWQTREGRRFPVDAEFVIEIDGDVAFRLGSYDSGLALTIDPVVEFATNLGGANNEWNTRLLAAADGSIFLAGTTQSVDFPGSLPSDHLLNRPVSMLYPDLYVSKLKNNASELAWSLYLGGTGGETLTGLGRDSLGNIYLLARTSSVSLPITPGAFKSRISQNLDDLCVLKLDAETGRLKASTFLNMPQSGDFADEQTHLAVDATGGVYVSSRVLPSPLIGRGFVPTPGAFDTVPDNSVAPALLRLNSTLTAAVYIWM